MNEQLTDRSTNGAASLDVVVSTRFAYEVANNPSFVELIQTSSELTTALKDLKKITTKEYADWAINMYGIAKASLTQAEKMRATAVAFPNAYTKLVNTTFKNLKAGFEFAKVKLNPVIKRWHDEKEKAAEEAAAKAAEKVSEQDASEQTPGPDDDGVTKVGAVPEPPAPTNVIKTEGGASVHSRMETRVKIVDPLAFLKAVVSKDTRYDHITRDLVEILEPKVRKLAKELKEKGRKGKTRKIPGVSVTDEKIIV